MGRNATLQGLKHIVEVLEERFEGNIFPLPLSGKNAPSDEQISLVASVFKGDDIETGQLHLDFKAYNFEYIPIELLSSIYEQFLRNQGKSKKHGAIYTPEPLADYLISELNSVRLLEKGMKILDPCCGSGIFLVLAYRRLIEQESQRNLSEKIAPDNLKAILLESCYGVERSRDACYIAEFSLILTMLDYIEPPDLHKNQDFKFPKLHNERVFECDLFDNSSEFWQKNEKFDWIIGNPPWIELKPETKGEDCVRNWIKTHSEKTVTGNRVCEAFTWRVTDLLRLEKTNSYVALLIHAPSLFNGESEKYRKDFFQQHKIRRVTNFSHLAYVLFYRRAKVATATIVYTIGDINYPKPNLVHYSPFAVNQISNKSWEEDRQNQTWTITINENEIQPISHNDIEMGSLLPWKLALWGSYRDQKIIQRLNRLFSKTIGELGREKEFHIASGLQLKNISKLTVEKQREVVRVSSLIGQQLLDIDMDERFDRYFVDEERPIAGEGRKGKHRRRLDIVVECSISKPRLEYIFEAKRLRIGGFPIGKYTGEDGLQCFINGIYASECPEAGMIGYIQSDDCDRWEKELTKKLDNDPQNTLKLKKKLQRVSVIEDIPYEWLSEHERTTGKPILIYHIFLNCYHI
ncbi:MAG: class I SAM-dependent DNA methyltransferase [Spirulina sp.]